MFKYKVLLIGASGRGKTYSFRNMDKEHTAYLNIENKPLPFKGNFKYAVVPANSTDVLNRIVMAGQNPDIQTIIIDSFSAYADMLILEARSTKVGYDIWNHYNEYIGKLNDYIKKVDKEVFVTAHYEIITDELGGSKERRAKVKGKEWEGRFIVPSVKLLNCWKTLKTKIQNKIRKGRWEGLKILVYLMGNQQPSTC